VPESTADKTRSSTTQDPEPVLGLRQNLGQFSLWRDAGYAFGALLSGIIADLTGVVWAIVAVRTLTFASGLVVALRMNETLKRG
jgi:hypothetical protein